MRVAEAVIGASDHYGRVELVTLQAVPLTERKRFVDPREVADHVPHFGRPGGVLTRVMD